MPKTKKLKSLSIFFPFYNDAGTVGKAIDDAYLIGSDVAKELEVIAINGGQSSDGTYQEIQKAKKKHPSLVIIDQNDNKDGYAVIKHGIFQAKNEWVFYTDGDLQYDVDDLLRLIYTQQVTGADVINGKKITRGDNVLRTFLGNLYRRLAKILFHLPISDPTCDFRLMKKEKLNKCPLFSKNASICVELIKELQIHGATFAEVPVRHKERRYGKSNYLSFSLMTERFLGDLLLMKELRKRYNEFQ